MTTERAQALEALKRLARDIGLVDDVAGRRGDPDAEHQQMRRRLKAWESEIFKALDLLAVPPPPPVGSPTTADVFKAGFQAAQRWGVDMEHEAWEDFATSVEPTPEPCRCEIYQSCEKCRKTDPVVFGAEQPTGEPAPCVWRDIESAPKDGTHILTHHEEGYEICWWQDAQPDAPDDMGHDAGWFGSVYSFPGRSFGNPSHFSESQGQPTHWMPLPVAPLKVER